MTLNLFSHNPLRFIISTVLIVLSLVLAWRLILAAVVVAAVVGIFFFVRNRIQTRQANTKAQESPQAEFFRDDTPHPERKILKNVEENDL
ncbi:hypothetical protein FC56_GL001530 [Lentilactobacillus senioris DSM 24302 = JCM 17472]|uniref:Uncharacterized protein n=1 Tax=Lentilactobacillus senioris DSM 24302 = JCM 17472 TaxID=1423802 RepID=A0A0R2D272_9LACO|nr:hypothetical protein [Lentilactobacillus senioris]KRM94571.1 hypothetical protein FC56_GL001530 [Lentilactobacillus senioris DSM 24302 = JCM 17472]